MNKWTKNRIKELTEERRDELTEYFFNHMWHDCFGEAKINELSLYYNKQYIPSQIEELKNNDRNGDLVRVLYEINSKYSFDDFWFNRGEIEKITPSILMKLWISSIKSKISITRILRMFAMLHLTISLTPFWSRRPMISAIGPCGNMRK